MEICDLNTLKKALSNRIDYFADHGCRASDHGLDYMIYQKADESAIDSLIARGLAGEAVTADEAEGLKTALLIHCASEYATRGWVMQIHYNCLRNPNSAMFARLGPDTGFDSMGPNDGCRKLSALLDCLYAQDALPKTVLYSLDPNDNPFLDSIIGAFQGSSVAGKLQHGSAWWFNDNLSGIGEQMKSLASQSVFANFIGMLTDSRSFLSYVRHDYFRRILCNMVGRFVEDGLYPDDEVRLGEMIKGISYNNAVDYFGFDLEKV